MVVRGSGIYMDFTDVPPRYEEEFNAWYDSEELHNVMAVPGVLSGARYVACKGAPKYLAVYELSNTEVTAKAAFKKLRNESTPWGQRILSTGISQNTARVIGDQMFPLPAEILDTSFPPVLQIGRHLIPANLEKAWNAWYNDEYIPSYRKVPGVLYARRYRVLEGSCQYMTIYEFENETVSESEAWANQRRLSSPLTESMRKAMSHAPGSAGVYRRLQS